jgi:3-dehydroquinate dehydratase-2
MIGQAGPPAGGPDPDLTAPHAGHAFRSQRPQPEPARNPGTRHLRHADACQASAAGFDLRFHQSNHEGQLIDWLHEALRLKAAGVAINAGAYTHTSVALHDAIKGIAPVPVIEVHLSNTYAREAFRHHSFLSPAVKGVICGFGPMSYTLALTALIDLAGTA